MIYTKETIIGALKDYRDGLSYREIAEKYKIKSLSSIITWIRKVGVQKRGGKKTDWNEIKKELK